MAQVKFDQSSHTNIHCVEERPPACGMVIFGASGDLTRRKLIPSLFSLFKNENLPENFFLLGFARTDMDSAAFREQIRERLLETGSGDQEAIERFAELCYYLAGDYKDPDSYGRLEKELASLTTEHETAEKLVFYLSVPPVVYATILDNLAESRLLKEQSGGEKWRRVIFEKPFGHDLESSRQLEIELAKRLGEHQIYRIDHYLGKETVQNIMMLRFANSVFEPLWNRRYVDHVQITVSEDIGIGHRAGYYDKMGQLRDMFQNHLLQIMALVAMEPPVSFAADHVRDEKVKVLSSIHPLTEQELAERVIRGQYQAGQVDGRRAEGYLEEPGVEENSSTETFVALKLFVENWRWKGVPFYLRSGKRLASRSTEVAMVYKAVPHSIFHPLEAEDLAANVLHLSIQPREGVALTMQAKQPGPKLCLGTLDMGFAYQDIFELSPIDAYGRLLLDIMLGDQTLFLRSDNIDMAWQLLTPILDDWQKDRPSRSPLRNYPAGSQGPAAAQEMMQRDQRKWFNL